MVGQGSRTHPGVWASFPIPPHNPTQNITHANWCATQIPTLTLSPPTKHMYNVHNHYKAKTKFLASNSSILPTV